MASAAAGVSSAWMAAISTKASDAVSLSIVLSRSRSAMQPKPGRFSHQLTS